MPFGANQNKELLYFVTLLVFFFCVLALTQLNAQVAGGTLSGRITSTTGAAVANARLTIKNATNGETKIITANEDGSFSRPNHSPGIFELTVSAPGLAEARTAVTMTAGIDNRADIVMRSQSSTGDGEGGSSGVSGALEHK